ncbi:myosin-2 heavy chain-like [Wyeomyia smithii]|uniref:myosin-2 heavy chain-like n=1 Tax=Wyeomyia smithii TaxID=174621 RepID=UPI002467E436|nr:myosin-2 heavy chain-like [Wyeomyia smithii]
MGKDSAGPSGNRRPVSSSPYAENYRVPMDMCQRHLINHRLMVSKLTRKELEDKYINLCDENFTMKKRFQEQELQVKKLKAKLLRLSSESSKNTKSQSDMHSSQSKLHFLEIQRRELHEKLEALRINQSTEILTKQGRCKKKPQNTRLVKEDTTTRSSSASNEDGKRNDRFYDADDDDDRREDSSTEEEQSSSKTSGRVQKLCDSCETMKAEKTANETEFVKMKMNIKLLNKEIQHEMEKNALLSRQLEEKLSYEIMRRNAAENMEVINLTRQLEDMHQQMQRQQEAEKRAVEAELTKQTELEAQVRKEKDKNTELFDECERLKKNIEKLKEHMSEVEIERDFLKRQQEGLAKIIDENKVLRFQLEELRKHNEDLARQIDLLKEEESVAKSAQKEMLEKLKSLQQDNDTLSVLLEGLRTENEVLAEEKTVLEKRFKNLEALPAKETCATVTICNEIGTQTESQQHVAVIDENKLIPHSKPVSSPRLEQRFSVAKRSHSISENESDSRRNSQKHVRISQVMNKIELLEHNSKRPTKTDNTALLISNKIEQITSNLKGTFENYDLRVTQNTSAQDSIATASPTSSFDKKRISFQADISDTASAQNKDSDISTLDEVQQNYAEYFGLGPASENRKRISEFLRPSNNIPAERIVLTIQMIRWKKEAYKKLILQNVLNFYVELVGFLDLKGHMLETRSCKLMLSNENSTEQLEYRFDHSMEFDLNVHKHTNRQKMLREMFATNGNDVLKFVVIHEQEPTYSEVGYATIRLGSEIRGLAVDSKVIETTVYSIRDPTEEVGTLFVKLEGINLLIHKFCEK